MKLDIPSFILKTSVLVLILAYFSFPYSLLLCLLLLWGYQYIIAFIYGVNVMSTIDSIFFFGDEEVRPNFMSVVVIDKFDFNKIRERALRGMKDKAKMR